jgi:hypothetical protein
MILGAIFLGGCAKPDAREEDSHDDRNDNERGRNVHDADSSPLDYQN